VMSVSERSTTSDMTRYLIHYWRYWKSA